MATNEFLPFATGGGANVLAQSDYAALPALASGFQSGVARSPQLNKVWRQSSVVAAMIGEFIADFSGQNAVDDGDVAGLEAKFVAALAAASDSSNYIVDAGAANALIGSSPSIGASIPTGNLILIKVAASNTTSSTLNMNALGAKAVVNPDGSPLIGGQLVAASLALLGYTGTVWMLLSHPDIPRYVQSQAANFAVLGGTANAITATLTPAPAAYAAGMIVRGKIIATNTGAATLNVNSLGVKSITRADGLALVTGDLLINSVTEMIYDGANFQVTGLTTNNRALQGQFVISASGTWTVPAGVTRVKARLWGGGGGGGGAAASSVISAGATGGGGGYTESIVQVTPGAGITVTVGTGGAGGTIAGTNGAAGGTTTFASSVPLVANGGGGGAGGVNAQGSPGGLGGGGVGAPGGLGISGTNGGTSFLIGSSAVAVGGGGSFGSTAAGVANNGVGASATSPGGAGGGASASVGQAFAGAPGAGGLVIIDW